MRVLKGKEYKDFNWEDVIVDMNDENIAIIKSRSTGKQVFINKDTSPIKLLKYINDLKSRYENTNITQEYTNIYKLILSSNISTHTKTELAKVLSINALEDGSTCHFDGNPTMRIKELILIEE